MRIIGFNFSKISVEKLADKVDNLKIDTKIDISEIEPVKSDIFKKEELLSIKFTYTIDYSPKLAKLELAGHIIMSVDSKMVNNILSGWKNKKMPEEFRIAIFNIILRKANIKALELEDEMNLPIHMPLPKVTKSKD